jgi:hypothetical protein
VCLGLTSGNSIRAICRPAPMPTFQSVYIEGGSAAGAVEWLAAKCEVSKRWTTICA